MEILKTECVYRALGGNRCWLAMQERTFRDDHDRDHKFFFVTRGDQVVPPAAKKPDAVVVIAFSEDAQKMLLTEEYRLAIDRNEIGSVAGLIDAPDYEGSKSVAEAATKAAIREVHEETGLELIPFEVSPDNLFTSAGMTDESVCMVIGKVRGTPSQEFLEQHEQIRTMMLDRTEILSLMEQKDLAFSKHVWPFLWMIKTWGFPNL